MCGIYGQLRFDGQPVSRNTLTMVGNTMIHRGPDGEGIYSDAQIGLGMRRLSIIDLDGGYQPFRDSDDEIIVFANGEIYNYRNLRTDLQAAGHIFRSESDCETILWGYLEWGLDSLLNQLNGMYAFAIWDKRHERLIVARDRLGIKPVYYHIDEQAFSFASEAKSLLGFGISARLNHSVIPAYLSLGYVPAPRTLFAGVNKLPVAGVAVIERGQLTIRNYWQPPHDVIYGLSESDWTDRIQTQLDRSVAMQMVSDVPLGAFLSGGIDSSAVVAMMSRHTNLPVKTYSIGFDGDAASQYYNELPFARQVATQYRTDHHEIIVRPELAKLLPELIWHLDEPMADSAFLTTFLVSKFARQEVTVILSGVGGDELFGGYRRYLGEHYAVYYQRLPSVARSVLRAIAGRLPADRHNRWLDMARLVRGFILSADLPFEQRYRSYIQVFADEHIRALSVKNSYEEKTQKDAVTEAFSQSSGKDLLNRLLCVDCLTQLPDDLLLLTDKMSMAVSLECRVPFLDHELVELAAGIPSELKMHCGNLKYLLKKALHGILSDNILYRKKRGFGAPMGAWLRSQLLPMMQSILSPESVASRGLFRPEAVESLIQAHLNKQADYTDHLQSLLNLEIWCRLYIDGQRSDDVFCERK